MVPTPALHVECFINKGSSIRQCKLPLRTVAKQNNRNNKTCSDFCVLGQLSSRGAVSCIRNQHPEKSFDYLPNTQTHTVLKLPALAVHSCKGHCYMDALCTLKQKCGSCFQCGKVAPHTAKTESKEIKMKKFVSRKCVLFSVLTEQYSCQESFSIPK